MYFQKFKHSEQMNLGSVVIGRGQVPSWSLRWQIIPVPCWLLSSTALRWSHFSSEGLGIFPLRGDTPLFKALSSLLGFQYLKKNTPMCSLMSGQLIKKKNKYFQNYGILFSQNYLVCDFFYLTIHCTFIAFGLPTPVLNFQICWTVLQGSTVYIPFCFFIRTFVLHFCINLFTVWTASSSKCSGNICGVTKCLTALGALFLPLYL